MKIAELTQYLDELVPRSMQESYDNCGLLVGDRNQELKQVLICLDCTPEIVDEAISKNCNLIISHHPVIFKGIKKLTGSDYVQQTLIKCIKNDISLYAIHTNLDNYQYGVNKEIGDRLGLTNLKILRPKQNVLNKLVVFVPFEHQKNFTNAMFEAGAGKIGEYEECSYQTQGTCTFKPIGNANPSIGKLNSRSEVDEVKLEFLISSHKLNAILMVMRANHPYEEVAYDVYPLLNENQTEGSGMYGELTEEVDATLFLRVLKKTFNCTCIRHTAIGNRKIKKVAFCGGSGSFLLNDAKAVGADVFITGDFKYHEFFDAENEILIADIGHYESEQYTVNLLADIIKKKFSTFAVHLTETNTNPINYF